MPTPFFMSPGTQPEKSATALNKLQTSAHLHSALPSTMSALPQMGEIEAQQQVKMTFPCEFMVKAMGLQEPGFKELVYSHIVKHAPELSLSDLTLRASGKGKYVSVSATIQAQSREQLDAIYTELKGDPKILYML